MIIRDRVVWDEDHETYEEPDTPENEEWMFDD